MVDTTSKVDVLFPFVKFWGFVGSFSLNEMMFSLRNFSCASRESLIMAAGAFGSVEDAAVVVAVAGGEGVTFEETSVLELADDMFVQYIRRN